MRAGRLRHRIKFQAKTGTPVPDGYGGSTIPWVDFATKIPAAIEPLSGRELLAAQAVQNETSHKVTLRYQPGITAAMRVVFGSRVFAITAPPLNKDERNRELTLLCSEGLSQG